MVCEGPPIVASLVPLEFFYLTGLAVFGLFLFFSFFIFRRAGSKRSGRVASAAMFFLALYVGMTVILYDNLDLLTYQIVFAIGFIGSAMTTPFWLHMALLFGVEEDEDDPKKPLPSIHKGILAVLYIFSLTIGVLGALGPMGISGLVFDTASFGAAEWPFCLWTSFRGDTGPLYIGYTLVLLFALGMSTRQLAKLAKRAQGKASAIVVSTERSRSLAMRNKYIWLIVANFFLLASGAMLTIAIAFGIVMPEAAGQVLLGMGGLIVGLVVSRHDVLVSEKNVAPDFYRSVTVVTGFTMVAIIALFIGEGGEVSRLSLVLISTVGIVYYSNTSRISKAIDSLFLGPAIAAERANIRETIDDLSDDPELIKAKIAYQRWSPETQKVFLLLGEGLIRTTIAEAESMHISTVDLHIRRIKDALATQKLEDIRSYAHKMLIHRKINDGQTD